MSITLYYWADPNGKTMRGTAEKIRFLLNEGELDYKDKPITQKEVNSMMASAKIMCGQLPVLQVGNDYIEMSSNIMEYLANMIDAKGGKDNKYSGLPADHAGVRGVCNKVVEFEMKLNAVAGKQNPAPDALIKEYFSIFNRILLKNDDSDPGTDEFCIGEQFTYADVALAAAVNAVTQMYGFMKLRPYTKLKEIHDKIVAMPSFEKRIVARAPGN